MTYTDEQRRAGRFNLQRSPCPVNSEARVRIDWLTGIPRTTKLNNVVELILVRYRPNAIPRLFLVYLRQRIYDAGPLRNRHSIESRHSFQERIREGRIKIHRVAI